MLVVDPQFEARLPVVPEASYRELESQLLVEGIQAPLVYWTDESGQRVLVDGHTRLKIAQEHGLEYELIDIIEVNPNVASREDVLHWIDRHQVGRRNLRDADFSVAIGRIYLRQKNQHGGEERFKNAVNSPSAQVEHLSEGDQETPSEEPVKDTAQQVADEYRVSRAKVIRSAKRAEVLGVIIEAGEKDLIEYVKATISQKDLTEDWNRAHDLHKDERAIKAALVERIADRYQRTLKKPVPVKEEPAEEETAKAADYQLGVEPLTKKELDDILVRLNHTDQKMALSFYISQSGDEAITSSPLQSKELASLSNRIKASQGSVRKSLFDYSVRDANDVLLTHAKRWCRRTFGDKIKAATNPTLQEVEAYAAGKVSGEKKAKAIAVKFWNYYESIGWVQGKKQIPIKDWVTAFNNNLKMHDEWYEKDRRQSDVPVYAEEALPMRRV